jgi:hypothetical protein
MDAGFTEPFVEKQRQISLVADSGSGEIEFLSQRRS